MKRYVLFGAAFLLSGSLLAADAKEEVTAAVKKLADASSYGWKTTTEMGGGQGGGRLGPGTTEGAASKDGWICVKMIRGDNVTEGVIKGDKAALKTDDGWQSVAELTAGGGGGGGQPGNRGRWMARTLQNYKAPAKEVADMLPQLKSLKKEGDAYVGEMTEEGVRALLRMGRPGGGGGNAPEPRDPKGSVKIWLKDGALAKYEYKVQATMSFQGNDMTIDRTTTVEIKDVGTAKVEVAEAAKKIVS
ncbi:MAG: hypothetical protein IPM17_12615 [Verrucomicrobia bacterium]|nr:hypothetical protein [Verrucomicrobiota bacterium]